MSKDEKLKALNLALSQIEKDFGKEAIMRLGDTANENVEADRGMLCVERGPLVYCAEQPDNKMDITEASITADTKFKTGKTEIAGTTVTTLIADDQPLTLIPYYAWCHRGAGKMRVWIPEKK